MDIGGRRSSTSGCGAGKGGAPRRLRPRQVAPARVHGGGHIGAGIHALLGLLIDLRKLQAGEAGRRARGMSMEEAVSAKDLGTAATLAGCMIAAVRVPWCQQVPQTGFALPGIALLASICTQAACMLAQSPTNPRPLPPGAPTWSHSPVLWVTFQVRARGWGECTANARGCTTHWMPEEER